MSGQWWENDLIVGPFADIPAANAWAAANPSALFPGLLATAGGVQVRWGGAVAGWVDRPVGVLDNISSRVPCWKDNTLRGYSVGSLWNSKGTLYKCVQSSSTDATWEVLRKAKALPGDIATSKLSCIGGTIRGVSAYTGFAIDLEIIKGGTPETHQIGFVESGELDNELVSKILATADTGSFASVTKIYDQSGANRHFVNPSTWTVPYNGFVAPRLEWSIQQSRYVIAPFVQFSPSARGATLANESATFSGNNFTMVCIGETPNAGTKAQFMCVGSYCNGTGYYSAMQVTGAGYGALADVRNPGGPTIVSSPRVFPTVNPAVLIQTADASNTRFYCNDRTATVGVVNAATAFTGAWIGDDSVASTIPDASIRGCLWAFYSSALTTQEEYDIRCGAYLKCEILPQRRGKVTFIGDSRVEGAWAVNSHTLALAFAELLGDDAPLVYSMGLGSQQQSEMLIGQVPSVVSMNEAGHICIAVSLSAVNDFISGNKTPAQSLDDTKANALAIKSSGTLFYAFNELATTNTTNSANTRVPQYRELLNADNAWMDGIIDSTLSSLAMDPSNVIAYPDGLHPSEALFMRMAELVRDNLLPIF